MPRTPVALVAAALVGMAVCAAEDAALPPVAFDGLGLGDFSAAASVSRALRASAADVPPRADAGPLDLVVRGPGAGRTDAAPGPLAAEVRTRIEGFDVAAGFQGDAQALVERMPRWTGRIALGDLGPAGGESLELRTRLESRPGIGRLGLEVGPRIERRLRRGTRFFLDGTATAEAVRANDAEGWSLPGTSAADSAAAVGLSARTGLLR